MSGRSAGAAFDAERPLPTVEAILEDGFNELELSPGHLALRGTAQADSIRCDWRGVARTPAQREKAIRFWLNIDDGTSLPPPRDIKTRFISYVEGMKVRYQPGWAASVSSLALGGLGTNTLYLTCYTDYTVHEYMLGSGPNSLATSYDHMGDAGSYDVYLEIHRAGGFGNEPVMGEGEYLSKLAEAVQAAESLLNQIVGGSEAVIVLAPLGAYGNVSVEAWQVIAQWDLQMDEDDVVQAVRYGASEGDPEHTQTLANLKSRITTAAASDAFANSRIVNASGLNAYYRRVGAYGDITPDDGSTATFTPAQPLPVLECDGGTAVSDTTADRALLHDCEALLDGKSTLAGTASLNWAKTRATGEHHRHFF